MAECNTATQWERIPETLAAREEGATAGQSRDSPVSWRDHTGSGESVKRQEWQRRNVKVWSHNPHPHALLGTEVQRDRETGNGGAGSGRKGREHVVVLALSSSAPSSNTLDNTPHGKFDMPMTVTGRSLCIYLDLWAFKLSHVIFLIFLSRTREWLAGHLD